MAYAQKDSSSLCAAVLFVGISAIYRYSGSQWNFWVEGSIRLELGIYLTFPIFRYFNGTHYLQEKYGFEEGVVDSMMDTSFNLGLAFVFPVGLFFLNLILYLIPLPAFIKAKFRE